MEHLREKLRIFVTFEEGMAIRSQLAAHARETYVPDYPEKYLEFMNENICSFSENSPQDQNHPYVLSMFTIASQWVQGDCVEQCLDSAMVCSGAIKKQMGDGLKRGYKFARVVRVDPEAIAFKNGVVLTSKHEKELHESHYLSFCDLTLADFDGLVFDLTTDDFFERIEGYGIALKPLFGHPVRIPGYGINNGYYSSDLDLVLVDNIGFSKAFDVSECQGITDGMGRKTLSSAAK
jgi:hypothetical protein